MVTVSASDGTHSGSAMVLLTPAAPTTGLAVTPPNATLAAGSTLTLSLEPAQTETLTWTCTPNLGTITPTATGATYTAPATVSEVEGVTVTATRASDGAHGSTSITLAPQATVTLTVSATSLGPGQSVTAIASGALDPDQLSWLALPAGAGTLQPTTGSTVTFTAAGTAPAQPVAVQLFAFATADDGAGALGLASSTVTVQPG